MCNKNKIFNIEYANHTFLTHPVYKTKKIKKQSFCVFKCKTGKNYSV